MIDLARRRQAHARTDPAQRAIASSIEGFDPCTVLLNNDLSTGIPAILQNLEQTVVPPLRAGWAIRRKSSISQPTTTWRENSPKLIGIDPWLINPYFAACGKIDFRETQRRGLRRQHRRRDAGRDPRQVCANMAVKEDPFVIVKADAGTYGMGIMTVKDGAEVRDAEPQAAQQDGGREGRPAGDEVIVQEGVYTFESINDAVAEPVIYMIDRYVVGGFYRVHTARGIDENLNAPGMHFVPLAFEDTCLCRIVKPGQAAAQPILC